MMRNKMEKKRSVKKKSTMKKKTVKKTAKAQEKEPTSYTLPDSLQGKGPIPEVAVTLGEDSFLGKTSPELDFESIKLGLGLTSEQSEVVPEIDVQTVGTDHESMNKFFQGQLLEDTKEVDTLVEDTKTFSPIAKTNISNAPLRNVYSTLSDQPSVSKKEKGTSKDVHKIRPDKPFNVIDKTILPK